MNLEVARNLQVSDSAHLLIHVLEAVVELLSIEGNDFTWSRWSDADEAMAEVRSILARMKKCHLAERTDVAVLFAPTGPIQKVSLGSGWPDVYEKVARGLNMPCGNFGAMDNRLLMRISGHSTVGRCWHKSQFSQLLCVFVSRL